MNHRNGSTASDLIRDDNSGQGERSGQKIEGQNGGELVVSHGMTNGGEDCSRSLRSRANISRVVSWSDSFESEMRLILLVPISFLNAES